MRDTAEPNPTPAKLQEERVTLLEEVFRTAPSFLHVLRGPKFVFELANEAYYRLVGRRDLIGRPAFEAMPEAAAGGYPERIARVMETGEPFYGRELPVLLERRPGSGPEERIIDLVYLPLIDADGTCNRVLGHGTDVTDHVQNRRAAEHAQIEAELRWATMDHERTQAALRDSEARYHTLFESIDEGFCIIEVLFEEGTERAIDYRFVEANPAFEQHTGLTNVIGRRIRDLAPLHESHWYDIYGRVALTGDPIRFDAPAEALGRWFDVYAFRFGEPGKHLVAALFKDVTSHKLAAAERERLLGVAETALEDAEHARAEAERANRGKSEFLAVMSHELRTPLNAISGYVDLIDLGIRGPVSDQQRHDLARIQQSQRHLLGLINQVLTYARVDAGAVRYELSDIPLVEALGAAEALVVPQVRARGLTYVIGPVPPTLAVRADREKLQQILLNLLSNAIKFTEPGGEVQVTCTERDGVVSISVADTGIGIAEDKLARIFEPFVQADQRLTRPHEGVGLGLAISRDHARGMAGDLTARSESGVGSVFTTTLPAA